MTSRTIFSGVLFLLLTSIGVARSEVPRRNEAGIRDAVVRDLLGRENSFAAALETGEDLVFARYASDDSSLLGDRDNCIHPTGLLQTSCNGSHCRMPKSAKRGTGGFDMPLQLRLGRVHTACGQHFNTFVTGAYTPDELRKGPAPEWGIKFSISLLKAD